VKGETSKVGTSSDPRTKNPSSGQQGADSYTQKFAQVDNSAIFSKGAHNSFRKSGAESEFNTV